MREVTAICPGSCGELLQGWIGDSQKLVSYGIDSFSRVTVSDGNQLEVLPAKVRAAAEQTLQHFSIPLIQLSKIRIQVSSELPIAKGMSSSTADIAAACQAVAAYFNHEIKREEILAICLNIERTDSILFPSLTLFEQTNGSMQVVSGWCPQFYVVVLEPDQMIATETCHSPLMEQLVYQQRKNFTQVYYRYLEAVQEHSLTKLGEAASSSAKLNQEILPKPHFSRLMDMVEQHNLLGINVAHSGSVVGLLVEKKEQLPEIVKTIEASVLKDWYTQIRIHKSYYQGVQLA